MGNHSGGAYSRHSFVEGEVASTRQVVEVVGAPYLCCPAWLVGAVLLLDTSTLRVQAVDVRGMFDSAVELQEGRMAGAAVAAAESDHYCLESQDQRRGRAAAELWLPHRVFVRVGKAHMKDGMMPGRAEIVREVGG